MRVLIGTYRRRVHVPAALRSLERHVTGIDDIVFIDDSGDPDTSAWLGQYGKVIDVGGRGYNAAMRTACHAAEGEQAFWFEEDFEVVEPVDLSRMSEILYHRPHLAQVALLRGPHFPVEHTHGGLIEALVHAGHVFTEVRGVIEQSATFTGNPSVWRADVFDTDWPSGRWSEDRKRDELIQRGYRLGFLPGIKVVHSGIRSGNDY